MSFLIGGTILEKCNRDISAFEKLVFVSMGSFADKEGKNVFPARKTLAKMSCCSVRVVQNAINRFKRLGVVILDEPDEIRGRTKRYRIDIIRALEVFGGAPEGYAAAAQVDGDTRAAAAQVDGAPAAPGCAGDSPTSAGAARGSAGAAQNPVIKPLNNPSIQPCAPTGDDVERATPANAHWNDRIGDLEQYFGDKDFNTWIKILIPESDDGKLLVLAVGSRFFEDYVTDNFAAPLGELLQREIKIVERSWVGAALEKTRLKDQDAG